MVLSFWWGMFKISESHGRASLNLNWQKLLNPCKQTHILTLENTNIWGIDKIKETKISIYRDGGNHNSMYCYRAVKQDWGAERTLRFVNLEVFGDLWKKVASGSNTRLKKTELWIGSKKWIGSEEEKAANTDCSLR